MHVGIMFAVMPFCCRKSRRLCRQTADEKERAKDVTQCAQAWTQQSAVRASAARQTAGYWQATQGAPPCRCSSCKHIWAAERYITARKKGQSKLALILVGAHQGEEAQEGGCGGGRPWRQAWPWLHGCKCLMAQAKGSTGSQQGRHQGGSSESSGDPGGRGGRRLHQRQRGCPAARGAVRQRQRPTGPHERI